MSTGNTFGPHIADSSHTQTVEMKLKWQSTEDFKVILKGQ
jgi:hypothetical protein